MIERRSVADASYLIGMYWKRNLWLRAGRRTRLSAGNVESCKPRSFLKSIGVPGMPKPSLEMLMSEPARHHDTDPST